jgi:cytoskeletal protein CcmA (bactofilin family)
MPPTSTPPPAPQQPTELKSVASADTSKRQNSWRRITSRSRNYGRVAALLGAILVAGGVGGYFISIGLNPQTAPKTATPKVETLSPAEISKLSQVGSQLGNSNQTLTIGANSVFQGKVNIGSDLTLGGQLNANGPVSISSLAISGATNLTNLSVAQALQVSGLTNAKNGLTVQGLAAINGNLSVSGAAAFGSLTSGSISAKSIQISGPFTIGHIVSTGPPVSSSNGTSIGAGGTTSVAGNDTSGTVTINVGSGAAAGSLANVTFRAAYGANVHVLLTPVSTGAATANVYVTHTPTGFTINSAVTPSGNLGFDYFVTQ